MAVIELGSDRALPAAARPARPARAVRWRLAAAMVIGAVLVTAGGSDGRRPALSLLASLPARVGDTFALAGDRVFVLATAPDGSTLVTSSRLPDGRPLWTAKLAGHADTVQVVAQTGVLLAAATPADIASQVTALDAGSGRVLWRLPDASVLDLRPQAGRGLLLIRGPTSAPGVRDVDLVSGAVVWSQPLTPHMNVAVAPAGRVVFQAADGYSRVLDEDTGGLLRTGRLARPAVGAGLYPAGRLLVATASGADSTVVTAYDPVTLVPRWQARVDGLTYYVIGCRPAVCVTGLHTSTVLDPATGAVDWHSTVWRASGVFGGRILASAPTDTGATRTVLLDASHSTVVLDLARWSVIAQAEPAAMLLAGDQSGRSGAWVATLATGPPVIRPLAWLPHAVKDRCQWAEPYLACTTYAGPVRIWRYRPGPP